MSDLSWDIFADLLFNMPFMDFPDNLPRYIVSKGNLIIQEKVFIAPFVSIFCWKEIVIGEKTQIGPGAGIFDFEHDRINVELPGDMAPIHIGVNCLIGSNAVILKGVTLGDRCIVGAGTVVTHSFPDDSVIVGNPGRILTYDSLT